MGYMLPARGIRQGDLSLPTCLLFVRRAFQGFREKQRPMSSCRGLECVEGPLVFTTCFLPTITSFLLMV